VLAELEVVEAEVEVEVVGAGEVDPVVESVPEVLVSVMLVLVPVVLALVPVAEVDESEALVEVPELVLDEPDGVESDEMGCSVRVIAVQVPLPGVKERRSALLGGQTKK